MNNIKKTLHQLKQSPLTVIVRTNEESEAWIIINAAVAKGIKFLEITLTIPNAFAIIDQTRKLYPDITVGAGTVLTLADAKSAIEHNAQYLVSPIYNEAVLNWTLANSILYVPGAMTVNEMYQAHAAGAQLIKVYPAITWSPAALALIAQPFAQFQLLVTGGITLANINQYFAAGVFAVGITFDPGTESYNPAIIADWIEKFTKIIAENNGKE